MKLLLKKIFSKSFLEISSFINFQYIAVRKGKTHSERKVLQMQKEMNVSDESLDQELPDEELIDTLIAISVVSKRLAHKLRVIKEKGEQEDGSHE
ncbi:hypothetical protein ASU35_05610 [Acetivibrio ethanolgignens]|uniref:Uncharacterized protein n=2 Tax=Bacillota TaxID=1239 RepID=A0A0V8QIN4_9FIRM|nr:hypothetical protein ASU35_05610 [Acetivibrio ethanolgignens]